MFEVLVFGGIGVVGQGVVGVLLEVGSLVLVVGCDLGWLVVLCEQFVDEFGLEMLLGLFSDDDLVCVLVECIVQCLCLLVVVIVVMGGFYCCGWVIDCNGDELLGVMQVDLMLYVYVVCYLLLLLQDNVYVCCYVMIGSLVNVKFWVGYGEILIIIVVLCMYVQVVYQEVQVLGVCVQMLEVCSLVCILVNVVNVCIEWFSLLLVGCCVVFLFDGCCDNCVIVCCDSSDVELLCGLLYLEVFLLWCDIVGIV